MKLLCGFGEWLIHDSLNRTMNCMWTCFEIFVVIFGELAIGCELRTMDSVILCRLRLNQLETIGGLVDSENGLLSSFILQVVYVFEYCYTLPCRYGFSCHWMLGCLHCVYRMTQLSMSIVNDWFNGESKLSCRFEVYEWPLDLSGDLLVPVS